MYKINIRKTEKGKNSIINHTKFPRPQSYNELFRIKIISLLSIQIICRVLEVCFCSPYWNFVPLPHKRLLKSPLAYSEPWQQQLSLMNQALECRDGRKDSTLGCEILKFPPLALCNLQYFSTKCKLIMLIFFIAVGTTPQVQLFVLKSIGEWCCNCKPKLNRIYLRRG